MTLPTFLGIGVPRGGTTWLHTLLASHPEIYMPTRRKEVRFFDRNYERGLGWYETFFPSLRYVKQYRVVGEISPQYYKSEECPERIFMTLPNSKLIIILRHPISRAYSVYGFHVQRRNFKGSFENFLAARPEILKQGLYSQYIQQYLCYFDKTQILAMLFEDAIVNTVKTKVTIADFLGVDPDKFPSSAGSARVNASSVPKNRLLYSVAVKTGHRLHKWHLDTVVDFVRRLDIERFLAQGSSMPPLDKALKKRLSHLYHDDFGQLEQCLNLDLCCWRDEALES
jgi:hypothetical protein